MIQVEHLTKYYGPKMAIQDVTFSAKRGEIIGFLGPNGAGKSTTMRILTGFLPPSNGTATIAGYDVVNDSIEVRRRIGYLPENVPLYLDMTVSDYLDFMAQIHGVRGKQKKQRVADVMERTAIGHVARYQIAKLSRGYRQRVGLAQAIVHNPDVLVLDEPTVGLDPNQIGETRRLIRELGGEHTVILSTHILPEVSMTCSKVVIINDGRVVAEDTPEGLTRRMEGAARVRLQVRGPVEPVLKTLRGVPGVLRAESRSAAMSDGIQGAIGTYEVECRNDADVREHLAATVVRNNWGLLSLQPVGTSLEDVFRHLTIGEETEPGVEFAGEIAPSEETVSVKS